MTDPEMDMFLRRAVLAAVGMMRDGASFDAMVAFHYAIGLTQMGLQSGNGEAIVRITLNGLDVLHTTAHLLAEETDFDLSTYATTTVASMHLAADLGVIMLGDE